MATGQRRRAGGDPLFELTSELVEARRPAEVDRLLCEGLVASDRYRYAWIDGAAAGPVEVRESAGLGGRAPTSLDGRESGGLDGREPAGGGPGGPDQLPGAELVASLREGDEPGVITGEPAGGGTVAGVPIAGGTTRDGTLVVGTDRSRLHGPERTALAALGRTAGFVRGALRRRELLYADAAVALEFDLHDRDAVPVAVSSALGCELALSGYVASGRGWVWYLDVQGATAEAVAEEAVDHRSVERGRPVADGRGSGRVEVTTTGPSLLDVVEDAGATVSRAVAVGGAARIVVEAPRSATVRTVVERLRADYGDGVELVARRELDRGVAGSERPRDLLDELTDRQLDVLEAAYRAGYFEWPRGSTAEEVAQTLDISGPTLHGHLRKAEAAVLEALFADGAEG